MRLSVSVASALAVVSVLGMSAPSFAKDPMTWLPADNVASKVALAPEAEWQDVISGQIQALQIGDASAALGFSGTSFNVNFKRDPDQFIMAVIGSGYGVLLLSRSHSFGDFDRIDGDHVVQEVSLVGPDLLPYRALYELAREDGGWRIENVMLGKVKGLVI